MFMVGCKKSEIRSFGNCDGASTSKSVSICTKTIMYKVGFVHLTIRLPSDSHGTCMIYPWSLETSTPKNASIIICLDTRRGGFPVFKKWPVHNAFASCSLFFQCMVSS